MWTGWWKDRDMERELEEGYSREARDKIDRSL